MALRYGRSNAMIETMTLRVASLLCVISLLTPRWAWAQDPIHEARTQHKLCRELLDKGEPCEAITACEAGLEARSTEPLQTLTQKARTACRRTRRPEVMCPEGQIETRRHCCWPGQVWSSEQCKGVPTSCPAELHPDPSAQTCSPSPQCEPFKTLTSDRLHCCWPGQDWDPTLGCSGPPLCPEGFLAVGGVCLDDLDNDGVSGERDLCPEVPEDIDSHRDDDGCPDPDNDGDGLIDTADACPESPEDLDGHQDEDGCPEEDTLVVVIKEEAPPISPQTLGGYITLGSGLVLGGVALGLVLEADAQREVVLGASRVQANDSPFDLVDRNAMTQREAKAIEAHADLLDTLALISVSLGGAAIATGVLLLVIPEADEHPVSIAPGVSSQGITLLIQGCF